VWPDRKAKLNKMIRPTDEQLNRAAAELCGYSIYYAEAWATVPNFCTNRNALPELWNVIEANGTSEVFLNSLWHQMQTLHTDYDRFSQWYLATAPPKMHVIAALISCMAWLADWEL